MNKIILGMTLVSISFWSCHKSSQNLQEKIENSTPVASMISHQKSVEVNIDLNKDCLPFDSLMTKVSYVKLETTGDNLVGGISQILFVDDKIIIVDAEKSKTITVYDGKGHFLYKIGTNTVVVDTRSDIALAYKDELYKLGKKEEIDEFYKGLTEDSNPILFFYELKF